MRTDLSNCLDVTYYQLKSFDYVNETARFNAFYRKSNVALGRSITCGCPCERMAFRSTDTAHCPGIGF